MENIELSKRDLFNAKNAANAIEEGLVIKVVAIGTYTDVDKDGKPVNATALKDESGKIYSCISATVYNCVDMLTDILADSDSPVEVKVVTGVSKGGRTFFKLQIV